jgi:Flp pilus assembly protein TadG
LRGANPAGHNKVKSVLTERGRRLQLLETLQQLVSANSSDSSPLSLGDLSMPSPEVSKASFRNVLRRFRGNRRGSAAVEFALVAPLFFALLFAIIETALLFFADQALETMAQNAARLVLTGQAQSASWDAAAFKTHVCDATTPLFTCANVSVDVKSYPGFANVNISPPIDANANFVSNNLGYSPGGPSDIVVVRLFYQWQLYVTGLGYNISNLTGHKRLLAATVAFRNEPYL